MSSRRRRAWAAATLAVAALAAGLLVASGTGSTARSWTWDAELPGQPIPGGGSSNLRLLVADGELALVASSEGGTVEVGTSPSALQPLETLAGDDPLVVFAAASPEGGPQRLVGVARGDVERVETVLRDGTTRELPLNEWRAFAYTSPTPIETAIGLVGHSGDSEVGVVRVPQTTTTATQQAPATPYTISNRGRPVPPKQTRGRLFERPYRLYLLATRHNRAFYRVQVTDHYTCWGAGKPSRIGEIGTMGCPNVVGVYPVQLDDTAYRGLIDSGGAGEVVRAGGIAADQVAAVALVDQSGRRVELTAVVDNVFTFHGPYPKVGFLRMVALDGGGRKLEPRPAQGEHQSPPAGLFGPRATRVEPSRLGAVAQRASRDGVRISVGRNGVVVLDSSESTRRVQEVLSQGKAGYHCFVVTGQNVRKTRVAGLYANVQPTIAFRVLGLAPPFDGCDIQGTYGHRWHDKHGTHSVVEIPFTTRGRRYFADRATARDLALFVRSRTTRELRTLTGGRSIAALRGAYGDRIMVLASSDRTAPVGLVGVYVDGSHTVFSERSSIGDRLYVELENGKIVDQNLRGLAFVF